MKIAIGQVSHETNTFSAERTTENLFKRRSWYTGAEMFERHRSARTYIGGFLAEGSELGGYEFLPTFFAGAAPSGRIAAETFAEIRRRFIEGFRAVAPFDGILLDLHGAGAAETSHDIEGNLMADLRMEFGRAVPIVTTLDLHGNITERMVDHADMMFGLVTYPHVDHYERGREAMRHLDLMLRGRIAPEMAVVRLPMIIPPTLDTSPLVIAINERCAAWEAKPGVIDCTFFHGFPHADGPQVATSVVAIADGDKTLAEAAAQDVAELAWSLRDRFAVRYPGADEGFRLVQDHPDGLVVINETSDNPGGGAPGDGTHLLRAMLEHDRPNSVFAVIADPEVVATAHAAGEGVEIDVRLGGKVDRLHGDPLPIRARVVMNTVADFVSTGPTDKGVRFNLGKSTRLRAGNVDIIVTQFKYMTTGADILELHGLDLNDCRIIGLKSTSQFITFYGKIARQIVTVDPPGITSFNLDSFEFRTSAKFIYPHSLR